MSADAASKALREKQKPLKEQYRSDPSSALVTLTTTGSLGSSAPLTCSLSATGAAKKVAGLHAAAGGRGFDASGELCSGDMLLEALVACFGVTIGAVATAMSIPLEGGSLTCSGDLDFRGTLGIKGANGESIPVEFNKITLSIRLDCRDEYKDQIPKLIQLSERYCVVLQTLRKGVDVRTNIAHVGKALPDTVNDEAAHLAVNATGKAVFHSTGQENVIRLQ